MSGSVTNVSGAAGSLSSGLIGGQTPASSRTLAGAGSEANTRFLTLLTAQLKNQDPMAPMDATTFVTQLAQLTELEQQTKSNVLLEKLTSTLAGSALTQNASLIGKSVEAQARTITVPASGNAPDLRVELTRNDLRNNRFEVLSSSGSVLRTVQITDQITQVKFDGKDANGRRLAPGSYAVRVVGDGADQKPVDAGKATGTGVVSRVTQADGTWTLTLADGRTVDASTVTTIAN